MVSERLQVEVFKAVRAPVKPAFVRTVLTAAGSVPELYARLSDEPSSVAVRLTGDRELRVLNRSFASLDETTDVLSFAGADRHIGDIAISWPAVIRQSEQYGHSAETELALLCVHGLLHLLGWDHERAAARREMSRLTRAALRVSKIQISRSRL
jgi:rRNA maturation RNase YbeY